MDDITPAPPKKQQIEPWEKEVWTLRFRCAGIGTPIDNRIARLLKNAKHHGLRCIDYGPVPSPEKNGEGNE